MSTPDLTHSPDHIPGAPPADQRELVTFRIGEQDFSMDIMLVREIRGWSEATVLPYAPRYVLGVINLRGAVVPIIDLAARLGLAPTEPGPRHVVIIVADGSRLTGFLVSAVSDILSVGTGEVQSVPSLNDMSASFLSGVITSKSRLLRILDVAAALPGREEEADMQVQAEAECLN
ncbi:purine-binding chemotaxis protein CheW [Roseivivax lentus]|uniref:Purine-binding chemotaxis protein CheW n=1 Tax=Roseivivax lentus TaxID=633194 RepID=A0A1N7MR93_9RHOB|nr:chemotaxis protein CheW [Roseivivax lentus]SIS88655.1 purine-binding chemotaxis protein CheW [Roseivivax lentus]